MKKCMRILFALLFTALCAAAPARAAFAAVLVDSRPLMLFAEIREGSAFLPLRLFCAEQGFRVEWDGTTRSVSVTGKGVDAMFRDKSDVFVCGGTERKGSAACFISDGVFYVPARSMAAALGKSVKWDEKSRSVVMESSAAYYADEDVYWLSHIISAESAGESLEGKIAVGNVVMNRVKSPDFPDTVCGVVFDRAFGVQFTPVANGRVYDEPTEESLLAAKLVLSGENNVGGSLYFFNPVTAVNQGWIVKNRVFCRKIGNHVFYY